MMKKTQIYSLITLSLLVSACSSGGGGSSPLPNGVTLTIPNTSSENSNSNHLSTNGTSSSTHSNSTTVSEKTSSVGLTTLSLHTELSSKLSGALITLKNDGSLLTQTIKSATDNDRDNHINTLVIGDKEIQLFNVLENLPEPINELTSPAIKYVKKVEGNDYNLLVSGYKDPSFDTAYQAIRYGVITQNGVSTLFLQGYATPLETTNSVALGRNLTKVPTSGKFSYQGNAFYGKDGNYQTLDASAIADFDSKQIDITLTERDTANQKLAFGATIDGNTFSGTKNGIETKGAFYGSLANDAGGFFYQTEGNEKGYNGVFGVTDRRNAR